MIRRVAVAQNVAAALVLYAAGWSTRAEQSANADAKTLSEFAERVNEYAVLREKLERAAPRLPERATPQQIDRAQRDLASRLQSAKAGAKQGDLFTPAMTTIVMRLMNRTFAGTHGDRLRRSILEDVVETPAVAVMQRYPDTVPLSTMPLSLLAALPDLSEELECRFIALPLVLDEIGPGPVVCLSHRIERLHAGDRAAGRTDQPPSWRRKPKAISAQA